MELKHFTEDLDADSIDVLIVPFMELKQELLQKVDGNGES